VFEIVEEIETEVRHFRLRWREYEEREGLGFGEFVSEEDERLTESSFILAHHLYPCKSTSFAAVVLQLLCL